MKTTVNSSRFIVYNQKGLTLIEVLVAVTLLAIGLLGVALMQVSSISGNVYSKEMATATELGQDLIEKLKASTFTSTAEDPTLLAGAHNNSELANALGVSQPNPIDGRGMNNLAGVLVPLRLYTRTWTVRDGGIGDPNCLLPVNMRCILVTVTWNDKTATTHTITLEGVKVRR